MSCPTGDGGPARWVSARRVPARGDLGAACGCAGLRTGWPGVIPGSLFVGNRRAPIYRFARAGPPFWSGGAPCLWFAGALSPSRSGRLPVRQAGVLVRQSTSAATGIVPGSQQGPSDAYSEGPLLWFRLGVRVATVGERHAPRPRTPVARTACVHFAAGGGHDDKWPSAPRCSSSVHVCVFGTLPHQREPHPRGRRCGVNLSPDLDALAPE